MRLILLALALCCAQVVLADGCAVGKSFDRYQETDQTAVIRLEPGGVTVDMYIAIDGIPKGETVTYILPFWHRPEGFTLEEMTAADFHDRVTRPVGKQIARTNQLIRHEASEQVRMSAMRSGLLTVAPLSFFFASTMMGASSKGHQAAGLAPYTTVATPNVTAELYHIDAPDVPTLVAQAGMPAAYARHLARYRSSYFAVMKLTGTGEKPDPNDPWIVRGVRYHFRHPMPEGSDYTYTYPLGTGASWPKPITLTQVYLSCPEQYRLQVDAPVEGREASYSELSSRAQEISSRAFVDQRVNTYSYKGSKGAARETIPTLTSSLLREKASNANVWHIAYLHSNPQQDITARITPRKQIWRLHLAGFFQLPGVVTSLSWLMLILAWATAFRCVLRPAWLAAGQPGSLVVHGFRYLLGSVLGSTAILLMLILVFVALEYWVIFPDTRNWGIFSGNWDYVLQSILATTTVIGLIALWVWSSRRFSHHKLHHRYFWLTWAAAVTLFIVLNVGLYFLVLWAENGVFAG